MRKISNVKVLGLPLCIHRQLTTTMKKILIPAFALIAYFAGLSGAAAQGRYGHVNLGNIVSLMAETKAADAQLEALQKQIVAKGEKMATDFQAKVQAFYQAANSGSMAPAEQQKQQAALEQEQQSLMAYEQTSLQQVNQKRAELIAPIVEKAKDAISRVAKANGFVAVFDTSAVYNGILFAAESEDITDLVKKDLGIE